MDGKLTATKMFMKSSIVKKLDSTFIIPNRNAELRKMMESTNVAIHSREVRRSIMKAKLQIKLRVLKV